MPLTGHVDRNSYAYNPTMAHTESCPSRGTWIEMPLHGIGIRTGMSCPSRGTWIEIHIKRGDKISQLVVPLTGHVDRNTLEPEVAPLLDCRAPHGARG